MKKTLIMMGIAAAFAGCSQELPEQAGEDAHTIHISTSIDGVADTRVVTLSNQQQTEVQVLRKDAATSTPAPTDFSGTPVSVTRETSGNLTFSPVPQYKLNNDYAFFAAYHPKGNTGSNKVTWTIDGATDIITTAAWSAGNYVTPVTTGMQFSHQLAQLEVICKGDPDGSVVDAVIQHAWGTISKIELLNTANSAEMSYNGLGMTFTGSTALALLKPDYTTAFVAGVAITKANAAVNAAGMFAPATSGTATITLKVYTSKVAGGKEVTVQLKEGGGTNKGFDKGLKHTVTLVFGADNKEITVGSTTITAWGTGYTGSGNLTN